MAIPFESGYLNFGPEDRSIQQRFNEFHRDNPRVYALIVMYARQVKAAGRQHYSMDCIFHRVRWHVHIETRSDDDFKLNDHYTSRYARMVMENEPDLADFFELRLLKSA